MSQPNSKALLRLALERTGLSQQELAMLFQTSQPAIMQSVNERYDRTPSPRWKPWVARLLELSDLYGRYGDVREHFECALYGWAGNSAEGWSRLERYALLLEHPLNPTPQPTPPPAVFDDKSLRLLRHAVKLLDPKNNAPKGEQQNAEILIVKTVVKHLKEESSA